MRALLPMLLVVLPLAGCENYPRDIDGTYEHILARGEVRVGLGVLAADEAELARRYAARVAQSAGVRLSIVAGELATDALIGRLDDGELDLVIDDVALDSPWLTEVSVIEPLAIHRSGARAIGLSPLARNGENRWIALLEREGRNMGVPK